MPFEHTVLWKTLHIAELCEGNTHKSIRPTVAHRKKKLMKENKTLKLRNMNVVQ